jgi:murein L,D-transpeptidase YafK
MKHTLHSFVLFCSILFYCTNKTNAIPKAANPAIKEQIDSIVIIKNKREMQVYSHRQLLKVYHVCLGPEPVGAKHFKNDGKTPEGLYHINGKNPYSHYHKCLGVSYPSPEDVGYANSFGRSTGGDIKIHGLPNGKGYLVKEFIKTDWTLGCIALTDNEIDELYAHVAVGTWVKILP